MIASREDFIKLLNSHKVKYLIVGAYAVIFYSIPRNTGDIDFFIESPETYSDNFPEILACKNNFHYLLISK